MTEEQLLAEHEDRIKALVQWLYRKGLQYGPTSDMEQEARIVFLERIRAYDSANEAGAALWTYARTRIVGHFMDQRKRDQRRGELRQQYLPSWNWACSGISDTVTTTRWRRNGRYISLADRSATENALVAMLDSPR